MNALHLNDKGGQLKTIQGKTSQFTSLLLGLFFFLVGVGGGGEFLGTTIFCRAVDYVRYYFSLRLFCCGEFIQSSYLGLFLPCNYTTQHTNISVQ